MPDPNPLPMSSATWSAEQVVAHLRLVPLPGEGGFYRETYRCTQRTAGPPTNRSAGRSLMTAIYYLVTPASYSLLHRLTCDELYHFYAGDPIELVEVTLGGDVTRTILGPPMFPQAVAQHVVPAGHWQGSRPVLGGAWGLVGTTCSPGFEFADFELARPDDPAWTDPSLAPFLHR